MSILNKINEQLKYYTIDIVEPTDNERVLCEDGEYSTKVKGYILRNKETGAAEHSTQLLPGIVFQAQHLDSTLDQLLNPTTPQVDTSALEAMPVEDVVAN